MSGPSPDTGGPEPLPDALDLPGCSVSPEIRRLDFATDSWALTHTLNGLSGPAPR